MGNLYDPVAVNYVHQLTKALQAKELYRGTRTTWSPKVR